jgi:hypothetical protein
VPRTRALTQSVIAIAAVAMLAGCSGGITSSSDDPAASGAPAASGGDFCQQYEDAGGTLATPGIFQVGMPADTTIADLSSRVEIFDAATPPADIATEWTQVRDLYAETVDIAETIPDNGAVVDPRIFETVKEIDAPATTIRDYLDANC